MKNYINSRRQFLQHSTLAGLAFASSNPWNSLPFTSMINKAEAGKRIGIIGLDTSHVTAFTKALNALDASQYAGYKVVAAYPRGSKDIISSTERIPAYTTEVQKYGVEIVNSIQELLKKVDVVMLETNDGRLHLEQALEVFKAGKRMFIDKPIAASLKDAEAIFAASEKYKVPIFSASSLRFSPSAQEIRAGKVGRVIGADAYSPMKIEKTHPDLFWYGIHGVETLFTMMGTGCQSVNRYINDEQEVVVGVWKDGRIGTFRGLKNGKQEYGGTAFGANSVAHLGPYGGYDPLLIKIIEFFETGNPPVSKEETLEIFAFMEAADASKNQQGAKVNLADMYSKK
ncbi:Gfo/Idh/MocA family protein [Aquirufa nivalisilvae]|uniref:Gfo/Idh/MocA family protein n=1 Tax=Aquirufa nivalisilvae TaxID=2516557 RepID=UPI0022A94619|nr:Gfo/Idh/MocA family oxidoreductase [Aquirufa nivalisilvae]MCZ2480997.1 Gfo/Idh/MocA family oxidoreductase [Aquirufa nivalisilvae]